MDPARRREINALALKIRRALDLDESPFQVTTAVNRLGGTIATSSETEASVRKIGDVFMITLADQPPTRQRFSIAHELGHLFLHMGYIIDPQRWQMIDEYRDSPKYRYGFSEEEFEAHEFAGALLMPEKEYREAVSRLSHNRRIPLQPLAAHFEVSADAARTRGQWLGVLSWSD